MCKSRRGQWAQSGSSGLRGWLGERGDSADSFWWWVWGEATCPPSCRNESPCSHPVLQTASLASLALLYLPHRKAAFLWRTPQTCWPISPRLCLWRSLPAARLCLWALQCTCFNSKSVCQGDLRSEPQWSLLCRMRINRVRQWFDWKGRGQRARITLIVTCSCTCPTLKAIFKIIDWVRLISIKHAQKLTANASTYSRSCIS